MKRARVPGTLLALLLAIPLSAAPLGAIGLLATAAHAADDPGARAAARAAQERYGGRVLDVERKGDAYRVKLLQESGKVKVVKIPVDDGNTKRRKEHREERRGGRDEGRR